MAYQVRCWDAFFMNWCMIPEDFNSEEEAISRAIELSDYYDCGLNGSEEMQVYVVDFGMGTLQMIGYVELNENDVFEFVETFC